MKILFFPIFALAVVTLQTGCAEQTLTYTADVEPIIKANCLTCHGLDGEGYEQSGQLLDSYEGLMKGTKFGPVVVPGSSVSSTLYRLVAGKVDPSIKMPHGSSKELPKAQVDIIAKWIDQGAQK